MSSGAEEIRAGQTVKRAWTPGHPGLGDFPKEQREPKTGRQEWGALAAPICAPIYTSTGIQTYSKPHQIIPVLRVRVALCFSLHVTFFTGFN